MPKTITTADLRATLFQCIEAVKAGQMDPATAKTVAVLASEMVKTAQLELQYAQVVTKLDQHEGGVSPGPLLLTEQAE